MGICHAYDSGSRFRRRNMNISGSYIIGYQRPINAYNPIVVAIIYKGLP